jgi:polyphosphate glucokinase
MTDGPLTLAIDVGGTGLKATVLDPEGEMLSERIRRDTPYPCTPPVLLDELDALAATQPHYNRVSVGYPERSGGASSVTSPRSSDQRRASRRTPS